MVAGLGLVVALPNLLLDFFGDQVNGLVQVLFAIFGEEVRAPYAQAHGTGKGLFGNALVVVFQDDPRVNRPLIQVLKLFQFGDDVIFNGFGQGDAVRNQNEFHDAMFA